MNLFNFTAYDDHGSKIEGEISAEDIVQAKVKIKQKKLILIELNSVSNQKKANFFQNKSSKVSLQSLEFITSELSILLRSGVRFDRGLDIIKKGTVDIASASLIESLSTKIKAGSSIAEAFGEFPDIFDPLYINMIKLGETSGNLMDVFDRLAQDLKFKRALQSKIIQSMTYPMVILCVCVACVLFVFNYIVPQMSSIFDRADELPIYTEILLSVSDWFVNYQWYLLLAIVVLIFLLINALKNERFKLFVAELGLNTPLIGKSILLVERIRFNSSMAMMLAGGVSLIEALKLSAGNIKNIQIRAKLKTVRVKVQQGGILSDALKMTPLFNEFNISLVEVGEESGELVPVFEEISNRSRQDFESWTDTITTMIEPLLILIMGGIVGSVVVVMLLSIVSTNDIGL